MSLPPRPFYSVPELAIRWSATPFDIIGWSAEGLLALSIGLPPVKTGPSETLSGIADVEAPNVMPLFRRDGLPSPTVAIRRVRKGSEEFRWICEPAEGVQITAADVLVRRAEAERFERNCGIAVSAFAGNALARRGGPGVPPRHDWDAFYAALARRIHDRGIPKTQAELVRDMLGWFETVAGDGAPDESTVRRKIAVVWRELNRAEEAA